MPWHSAEALIPRDGEKILFHCRDWRKSTWEIGRYCKGENRVYNHYIGRTYDYYEWDRIDWWFSIPAPPTARMNGKTNAA